MFLGENWIGKKQTLESDHKIKQLMWKERVYYGLPYIISWFKYLNKFDSCSCVMISIFILNISNNYYLQFKEVLNSLFFLQMCMYHKLNPNILYVWAFCLQILVNRWCDFSDVPALSTELRHYAKTRCNHIKWFQLSLSLQIFFISLLQ